MVSRVPRSRGAHRRDGRNEGGRVVLIGIGALLLVVIGFIAWVGMRGLQAKGELEAALPLARAAQQAIVSGDTERAIKAAEALATHASTAASLTNDDPIWGAAEVLPWVGPNLESMRVITASVERVSSGAVLPLAEAAERLDIAAFQPEDGRLNLAPITELQEPIGEASAAIADAMHALDEREMADGDVLQALDDAHSQLAEVLSEAASVVDALNRAAQLVPAMLGADGPRDILLLFQNNAELRSTGGIPGALALLHTDGGEFQLAQQANSADFPRYDPPVVELPVETRALWGENTARYIQDVTFTPQFAVGASVAREMWAREYGTAPASVVALDPVVLSYLLRATGPITLPTGDQLTAENAVQLLLRDVYDRYKVPAEQDAFFAGAAASVLSAVSGGNVDPRALIDALVQGANERRILIWNADPAEQAILQGTTLAGELPISGEGTQAFGVYLNDMTMSKMDAYLDVQMSAGAQVCREDGLPQYVVDVSLTNTAPLDAATSLPEYVTGGAAASVEPGNISTSVHVYSAPGTFNMGVTQGGAPSAYAPTTEAGYTISKVVANLAPGESTSWRFTFLGDVAEKRNVVIQSTPMIYKSEVSGLALSCD